MSIEMIEVEYKCAKCGSTDTMRIETHERPWLALDCWKCGAGRGINSHEEMVMKNKGMFPLQKAA